MFWVDPTDPEVIAVVVGDPSEMEPDEETLELVRQAIAVAGEILTLATGFVVHPAGEITEEYLGQRLARLSMLYGPVTAVIRVALVGSDDTEQPITNFRRIGQTIYLSPQCGVGGSLPLWRTNWSTGSAQSLLRATYRFANTITPAARQALLAYAHEFFLLTIGSDDCDLPARVTSIDREGLGIQLLTPADVLNENRTGIQAVDDWLSKANRPKASRPSQVFTPDAPPGVGTRMRRIG